MGTSCQFAKSRPFYRGLLLGFVCSSFRAVLTLVKFRRAEEGSAKRSELETLKVKQEMENQLKELKEALEVEQSARTRAEKSRRELSKELESLRLELDKQQKREPDVVALKKSVMEEALVREVAMSQLQHEHTQLVEELNEKLETTKKGKALLEKAKHHLEEDMSNLRTEVGEVTTQKTKAEHKVKVLENQLAEANARLADNQVKMQKELEETNALVDELESKCSDVEIVRASPESQLGDMQIARIQKTSVPAVSTSSTQEATNRKGPTTESSANRHNDESTVRKEHNCMWVCTVCNKRYKGFLDLQNHKRVHYGSGKLFQCTRCLQCFNKASSLQTHEIMYCYKEAFQCTQCQKCFGKASSLRCHLYKIHSGEKPFKCSQCHKCFTQASNLRSHERTHRAGKEFSCTQCQKRFRHASGLDYHKKIHSGEKPYPCPQCQKCFRCSGDLVKHKRTHVYEMLSGKPL